MPTPFAEHEKRLIRAKLREAAEVCLTRYGAKKNDGRPAGGDGRHCQGHLLQIL